MGVNMKKGKYQYLFGNMALFTVSNFVSKILVMLLVPFYTNVLTTSEYGIADVMQATLLLLVPLLSLNMGEAALRFGLEEGENHANILKTGFKYVGLGILGVSAVCCFLAFVLPGRELKSYAALFAVLFFCDSVYEFMLLFCQGAEKVKVMITGSVSCTLLVILSNLFFLLVLKIGLYGYLAAQMISFLGAAMLMFVLMGGFSLLKEGRRDPALEKEMTHYGKSMLLYSTSSWVNNAIDRYFVLAMLGTAVNGLYGVAYKIPAILTVFQRIFAQAWQMSAAKNYREEDSVSYFSNMYIMYNAVMVTGCSFLILTVRIIAKLMFAKEFFAAWSLVPPLLISVIFGALTGFLGSICLAYKDAKSMGWATGIGACVNIVLNAVLISCFGAFGAAIATMISYFTMYAASFFKVRKHVKLQVHYRKDYLAYLLLIVQMSVMVFRAPLDLIWAGLLFMFILIIYGKEAAELVKGFMGKRN